MLDDPSLKHEVERNLDLIRLLGGAVQQDRLEIWPNREDKVKVRLALKSYAVHPHEFLVAFGPGAGAMKRQWPLANFVQLGAWFQKEYGARIVVVGGPGEERLAQSLQQQLGDTVINFVGHMTLRQTGVLLQRCNLYVGNDSGPMHLAAAASIPVIEISCHPLDASPSHPNSPKRFRPWGIPYRVLQPEKALYPCSDGCNATQAHCIASILVEQVQEAIAALLLPQLSQAQQFPESEKSQ